MSKRWSCATLGEGARQVSMEASQATPDMEEQELLRQIQDWMELLY